MKSLVLPQRAHPGVSCLILLSVAGFADATLADEASTHFVEEMTIVGARQNGEQVAGSGHYVNVEQIEQLGHNDIQRIIRQIPGVSIQIEDGYGLRPNISIRGVATERSGRITLLEDNVLIAPAPYSAPSAYYFPTVGRMAAIEVLKGPAAITQGPYTIGGALNMISVAIPEEASGKMTFEAGEDATYRLHGYYGARSQSGFGFLVETQQWHSDGFQSIDGGGDTGLDVTDYTFKLSYAPDNAKHRVEMKLQYAKQDSDQTYLGLTDRDFRNDAFRRYGLSSLDNIETQHKQIIVRYEWDISDSLNFDATYYNNTLDRNWFKTEGIDFDGSINAESFSRSSWSKVIQAVNNGDSLEGLDNIQLQGILDGNVDTPNGSIQVRSNAREYYSRGVQFGLGWDVMSGDWSHAISIGVRIHEDEEDRLQRNSNYRQASGRLVLDDLGLLGNAGNRIQEAQALAIHIYDRIEIGDLTLTPGLRYEGIEQKRTRYETRSGRTINPASRAADSLRDTRSNNTSVWLPGMGALYSINDQISVFAGVHKGFTAPSNSPGVDEEEAVNYELGIRFNDAHLQLEATYFLSDYDNLLGQCTASSGSECEIGDAFNGDAATVQGFELLFSTTLNADGRISMPLELAYTFIDSKFDTDIASTDFFGDVSKGDPIPYIPKNQLNVSVGVVGDKWDVFLAANYVDEVCVRASCGVFEKTDNTFSIDVSSSYQINKAVELFARIENLTGEQDILGRHPYGARPNKDTTASAGFRLIF